jgi:zinc protease
MSVSASFSVADRVFVEPSTALPIVSVVLAFASGSSHDPPGKEGLARITARMLRRGAEGMSSQTIEESVDALGAELGADTSVSAISVHVEVIKRNVDAMIDLIAKVISRPAFPQDELSRLLREAEAEIIESRDSDQLLASRAFRRALFAGHPYGRRGAGTIPTLATITRDDVQAFYRAHYTRANAFVAISGDVTVAEGNALAERLIAGLPEGQLAPQVVPPPPAKPGQHLILVDKADRTQTQLVIGGLGTDARDADHVPLLVAATVFGGTFSSRLMQEIRAKRGWSYGASARVGFDRQRDAFTMWTAPSITDVAACLTLELDLLHKLREDGVTDDELSFVKGYLTRSHAFEIDTARKRVHQRLDAALFDLPEAYHAKYLERVGAVDREAANAAVRLRMSEDDLVMALVGSAEVLRGPIEEAIAASGRTLASVTVVPFDIE